MAVEPLTAVPLERAAPFACERTTRRHPRETKGLEYRATTTTFSSSSGAAMPALSTDIARSAPTMPATVPPATRKWRQRIGEL